VSGVLFVLIPDYPKPDCFYLGDAADVDQAAFRIGQRTSSGVMTGWVPVACYPVADVGRARSVIARAFSDRREHGSKVYNVPYWRVEGILQALAVPTQPAHTSELL
jgi:hypothetical protein